MSVIDDCWFYNIVHLPFDMSYFLSCWMSRIPSEEVSLIKEPIQSLISRPYGR